MPDPAVTTSGADGFADPIRQRILQSENDGGISLRDLSAGDVLEIQTESRTYLVEKSCSAEILISGHPRYCPTPVAATVVGSTWGGAMVKPEFIGCGMRLEYRHPVFGTIRTSRVRRIRRSGRAMEGMV